MRFSEQDWLAVIGYEGSYEVSSQGEVRSLDREVRTSRGSRRVRGKVTKSCIDRHGYEIVSLQKEGVSKRIAVHILVAEAHIGPKEGDRVLVNHKDGNKENNVASNLEWMTYTENNTHAAYTVKKAHLTPIQILSMEGEPLETYSSLAEAARAVGGSAGNISSADRGRIKSYKGYKWKRVTE